MELDLLAAAETESDSESNHSNQDNASGRRSVVTAATAGSEAGMCLFPTTLTYTQTLCVFSRNWLNCILFTMHKGDNLFITSSFFPISASKEGAILVTFLLI